MLRLLAVVLLLAGAGTDALAQNAVSYGSQLGTLPSDTRVSLGIDPAGLFAPIALDANHYQMVNCALGCSGGGGGGSNTAAGALGSTAPNYGSNTAFTSNAGTLVAVTLGNPFPITDQPLDALITAGALKVSAASLPLPAGAATAANQPVLNGDGGAPAHVTNFPANQQVSLLSGQQTMQSPTQVPVSANTSTLIWTTNTAARSLKLLPESNSTCRYNDTGAAASATVGWAAPTGYVWNLAEPPPNQSVYAYCTTAATIDVSQGN